MIAPDELPDDIAELKAVIQRQQRVPLDGNDHGFLFLAENG